MVPERSIQKDRQRLFAGARSDRTRGNDFKVKEWRFRSNARNKLLTVGVVKHWDRLSREAADVPFLEALKTS